MIDFNKHVFHLEKVPNSEFECEVKRMFVHDEKILSTYGGIRDGLVFTNKRIIAIDVKGITGQRTSYVTIPYKNIQTFSVETAGSLDLDGELEVWISGLGCMHIEFSRSTDMQSVCRLLSRCVFDENIEDVKQTEATEKPITSVDAPASKPQLFKGASAKSYPLTLMEYNGVCPTCNTKFYKDRSFCYKCGAQFGVAEDSSGKLIQSDSPAAE